MKIAIYPGSFDPITLGHMDIIRRAAQCFDQVYVCVLVNCDKKPMFSADERVDMIRRSVADLPNVTAEHYSGLAGLLCPGKGGLRPGEGPAQRHGFRPGVSDGQHQPGHLPGLETVFLPASPAYQHFSSTMVREMIRYGQPMEQYVPAPVAEQWKGRS